MFNDENRVTGTKLLKLFVALNVILTVESGGHAKLRTLKYLLHWTSADQGPLVLMPTGHKPFTDCLFDNCYITNSKDYFSDITHFDAILFRSSKLNFTSEMPTSRHFRQKYVFVSEEPASLYPLPQQPEKFFNMTWTYKLDSDITFRKIMVKNNYGEEIGPRKMMRWLSVDEMLPCDNVLKSKLSNKSKAVAWIEPSCTMSRSSQEYVNSLSHELAKLGLTLDIYGNCGSDSVSNMTLEDSLRLLENEYYFTLANEKALDEDYVTEKLLYGLQHFTVPIVFGGANYSRFMPDGMYLNARDVTAERMAQKINEIMVDKDLYYEYFKWHGYYSFHNPEDVKGESEYCKLCEVLNDEKKMQKLLTYINVAEWWNRPPQYRAQLHSIYYSEPKNFSRRYTKNAHFRKQQDEEILQVIDEDDTKRLLATEPSFPDYYTNKVIVTTSKNIEETTMKSNKQRRSNDSVISAPNIERRQHSGKKHKHHTPWQIKGYDQVDELYDDLPVYRQSGYFQTKAGPRAQPNSHLDFFFDVSTVSTASTNADTERTTFITTNFLV